MVPDAELDRIRKLELDLLDPAVRSKPETVSTLLAGDFVEFGRSGRVYSRDEAVRSLATEDRRVPRDVTAFDFRFKVLAGDAVLLTYRTVRREPGAGELHALRSSIWTRSDASWRMAFHQATPAAPPEEPDFRQRPDGPPRS